MTHFTELNAVYAEYFPHKPARGSLAGNALPARASMEMDIVAFE
jgi:2-iminobutanoate/2-iminopropanoate deaminase